AGSQPIPVALVPRLCLGTHRPPGSAWLSPREAEPRWQCSQAAPGNKKGSRFLWINQPADESQVARFELSRLAGWDREGQHGLLALRAGDQIEVPDGFPAGELARGDQSIAPVTFMLDVDLFALDELLHLPAGRLLHGVLEIVGIHVLLG